MQLLCDVPDPNDVDATRLYPSCLLTGSHWLKLSFITDTHSVSNSIACLCVSTSSLYWHSWNEMRWDTLWTRVSKTIELPWLVKHTVCVYQHNYTCRWKTVLSSHLTCVYQIPLQRANRHGDQCGKPLRHTVARYTLLLVFLRVLAFPRFKLLDTCLKQVYSSPTTSCSTIWHNKVVSLRSWCNMHHVQCSFSWKALNRWWLLSSLDVCLSTCKYLLDMTAFLVDILNVGCNFP